MLVDVPGSLGWPCLQQAIMGLGGNLYPLFLAWFAAGRRPRPFVFRPPKNTRFLIWLAKQLALPIMLRLVPKIAEVELNEQDLRRLGELKGERVILAPNHSGGKEPYILFHLSKMLGREFNYLTAKEVFDHSFPIGWLLQRLGAYSIIRGTPDRSSFRMTRDAPAPRGGQTLAGHVPGRHGLWAERYGHSVPAGHSAACILGI